MAELAMKTFRNASNHAYSGAPTCSSASISSPHTHPAPGLPLRLGEQLESHNQW